MKLKVFWLIILGLPFAIFAQNGPGGVGTKNGASELVLWLAADGIPALNNGNRVDEWPDLSGYNHHANNDDPTIFDANTPIFLDTIDNGGQSIKAVRFDGNDDWYNNAHSYTAQSIFIVYNFRDALQGTDDLGQLWGAYGDGAHVAIDTRATNQDGLSFDGNGGNSGVYAFNSAAFGGAISNGNTPAASRDTWEILSVEFTSPQSVTSQVLGSLHPSFSIAAHNLGADIAEIIVYSGTLNDAQRLSVENYLSSKYNVDISASGNDHYGFEAGFGAQVSGIGNVAGDYDTTAFSSDILGIDTLGSSTLDAGDFLFMGHDSRGTTWTTTDVPTMGLSNIQRIAREWRVDETNEVGNVRFLLDTTTLGSLPADYDRYVLIAGTSGNMAGANVYEMSRLGAGSPYWQTNYDPTDGDFLTVGIIRPVLGFASASSSDFETVGSPSVSVALNYIPYAETSFNYSTSDNGAVGGVAPLGVGVDYELIASTPASIMAGANPPQITFNLNINEDSDQEGDEGIDINLSGLPTGVNALNAPQTFTIQDDDNARKIYFARSDTTISESISSLNVQANMTPSQVDPTNPTTVEYSISGGTALASDDFTLLGGGVVTIPANNISATFPISIVDDAINESVETIIISLSSPTNSNLSISEPTDFTVNITDNDQQPTIQFNAATSSDLESNTNPSIVLTLSAVSGVDAEVNYTISGSATGGGDDFTLVNGTATILAGSISTTIDPMINADSSPEEDETIIISLGTPTNALLGSETVHTYTIANDDGPFGFEGPGGVGGASVLPLWLKADGITGLADGADVVSWNDVSGSGNDANQSSSAYRATWENAPVDQINGFPVVRFDGIDDHYDDTGYSYSVKTAFIIFKVNSSTQSSSELAHIWGSYNELVHIAPEPRSGGDQFGFSFDGNQSGFGTARYGLDGADYGALVDDGKYYPWSYDQVHMVTVEYDDLETLTRQILGGLVDNFSIGAHHFGGDVAEIVVFNQELSVARRLVVENYLAAKYGITLPVGKDLFAHESTHNYDMAGIGQDANGDAHRAAQSNNILRISNPSSLNNGEYLLFGHDNASLTWSSSESPADSVQRIAREWAVDETGNVGTLSIAIDTTSLLAKPSDHMGYVLLVDDNGDFSSADGGTTIVPLTKSGKYYLANNVELSDGNYLSVGTVGITAQVTISMSTASESAGTYELEVVLSRSSAGDTDLTFDADISSTADEGALLDFTITSPLQILAGSTTGNISITINNDGDIELDETVIINLLSANNGVSIAAQDRFTLTIQDDDASTFGTTGPGGVGMASSYEAWWSADSAVFSDAGSTPAIDGGGVQQWNDLSGSTQAHPATITAVSIDPNYNLSTNLVNGKPAIDFGAGDSPLTVLDQTGLNDPDRSERTFAVAFETGSDLSARQVIYEEGGGTNGMGVWIESNTIHLSIWDGTWDVNGDQEFYDFATTDPIYSGSSYVAYLEYDGNTKTITAFLNSKLLGSVVIAGDDGNIWSAHGGLVGIGGQVNDSRYGEGATSSGDGNPFTGKVMEAIVFNGVLNDAQSLILQSYLRSKYDANLSSGSDLFAYKTTHSHGVAGLGQQGTEFHSAATSDSLLTISNPSALASGEFLLIGHDNGGVSSFAAVDIPNSDFERLAREWRVSLTGLVGTVKVTFDPSSITAAPGAAFSQYALLVDGDGDFSSGAAVHTLYQRGSVFETDISLVDGDYVAIAAFRPTIQFVPAVASGDESVTAVEAVARLTYPVDGTVTVDYTLNVPNSTASRGSGPSDDFDFADGTLNINSGDSTATIGVSVNDDAAIEPTEIFEIDLSNPSSGLFLGDNTTFAYSIQDDDQPFEVEFTIGTDSVAESNGSYNVTLRLNQAAGTDVDVDYSVIGGSADGSDFSLVDGTATILSGGFTANILVGITEDPSFEDYETIVVQLSNPVNASIGDRNEFTLVIEDNDPLPQVSFVSASSAGAESEATAAFAVQVSEAAGVPITVDYEVVTSNTTASVADYSLSDGILTIPAGSTSIDIVAWITNDLVEELDESIQIRLFDNGNLANASLGAVTVQDYVIQDNDAGGFVGPGGVGLPSDYVAWLRADRLVERDSLAGTSATNGSVVQRWVDYSGAGNNAKGADGREPRYLSNAVNGKPSIDFGGLDSALFLDDTPDINTLGAGYSTRTIMAAFRAGSDVSSQQVVYEEGGGGNGFAIYIEAGNAYVAAWTDPGNWGFKSVGTPISSGQIMVATLEFNFVDGARLTGYFNADSVGTATGITAVMPSHGGDISIGGSTDSWEFGGGDFFDGEVMEVMIGNFGLTKVQRTIVENYLGAKYGANLSPSGRRYFDHAISHGFGVVGIGRENISDFHVKSESDSLITISNAADLGDGEYFFIGNDNGSIADYNTNDVPGSGLERLGREWRVSESGEVGAVTVTIDTAYLGIAPSTGYTEYVLLVDADGTFASGATLVPLTAAGASWQASIDLSDGDYFTLGVIRPEVQFASASTNGSESVARPLIEVTLNYPLAEDLNFTVTETGTGTATESADFTFTDGTQTIAAGNTSLEISPAIINDAEVEGDETIIFELSLPSSGIVGANDTHVFKINDDDNFRKANLALADSANSEDQSPIQIGVFLNARNSLAETQIFYSVTGGTAANDSTDYYVQEVDTLVYAIGDTLEYIDINVVDDLTDEDDETVIIALTGGMGATIGDTTVFTYTIQDNDLAPTVQFTSATRSGVESAQTVDLAIELSAPSGKDVTVPFSAVDLTATASDDYQITNSSVTILAGSTTDSIQFIVVNDGITEANEQLRIDLGAPTNAGLGANGSLTYSILDDDGLGFEGLGGVGNLDEQIAAWFKATDPGFGLSNGDAVSDWQDNTNNANNGFQASGSSQPQFLENVWNGRPVLSFDGNDLIQLNDTDDINTGGPFDQKTIMVAFRTSLDVTTRQMLYEEGGGVRGLSIYIDNGSLYIGGWNNNDDDSGATTPWPSPGPPTNNTVFTTRPVAPNSNNFVFLQFDFLAGTGSIDGDVSASINGENLVTVDGAGRLFAHPGDIGIGGINEGTVVHDGNEGSVQNYNGNMGEVVVQNFVYNPAQFVIVNNYLSSKYNITLASVPDIFAHDQSPTNYSYELFGIGQVNDSSHIDAKGAGLLRLSNPTQLDNDEFMLIGHDNEGVDAWLAAGVPEGDTDNFRLLDRNWRADETGDVGLVTVQLDASGLPAPPVGFTANYVLLVDADGDFSDGAAVYGLTSAGGYYGVANIDVPDDSYIAVGLANLVLGFTVATSDGVEDVSPASMTVAANYVTPTALTLDVATSPNSTAQPADYTLASSTANIAAGSQEGSVILNLVNDSEEEPLETVELVLTNPSGGVLSQLDTTIFTIIDDDQARHIEFVLTDSTGSEADSPALIRVYADSLSNVDSLKVYYQVTAGTATATEDYILAADTLKWPRYIDNPNDTIRTISLAVVPDLLDEQDETIEITLFSPIQAGFGGNRVFTYTITDDDSEPTIDWQTSATSGLESVTEVHAILQLSAPSGQDITLNYSDVSSDPPTPGGIDYDLQGTSLVIPAGVVQDTITFTVFDDAIDGEGNEDVVIQIDGATGATAAVGSTFTYSIIDDDGGFGAEGPGGIGDENQMAFWFKGDGDVFSDLGSTPAANGNDVRQWNDESGNSNHALEVAVNDSLPEFETPVAAANNQNALSFDASNFEFLTIPDNSLINTATQYARKTVAIVFETGPTDPPAQNQVIYEQGGGGNGFNIYHGSDGLLHFGAWSTNASPSWGWSEVLPAVDVAANQLMMVIFEIDAESGDLRAYVDGNAVVSGSTGVINSFLNSHGGDPGIGGVSNDTRFSSGTVSGEGNFFDGRIFELVQYNERVMSAPTRKVLQNYFAAKYSISIGIEDIYAHEGSYGQEVFGMGIENDEIHVASSGSGIVRIDNPQTIVNGNYLLAGHDGGDASSFTTANTPPEFSNTFMQRIDRTWRVDETGEFGSVRVSVDLAQLPTFVTGFTDLFLVVGTASDFSTYDTLVRFNETFGSELRTTYNFADDEFFTIALAQNASGRIGPWNDPDTWLIGVPGLDQPALIQDSVYLTTDVTVSTIVGLNNTPSDRGKLNLNGFTLTVTDSLLIQGFGAPARDSTTFGANGGTVDYGGSGTDIYIQPLVYHNLTLSGTGRRFLSDKTVILNDIVIDDNPQVISNNHNLDVSGDWVSAVNSEFTPGTGTVTFNGSGPQEIRPTNRRMVFNNLVIDKAAGDVSLADSVEVTGVLTLTQNDLVLGSERLIISNSAPGAIVTPGDNSSYIQADGTGVVEWSIVQGNTYTYPIGDASNNYTPFAFAASTLSGTDPTLSVNLTDQRQANIDAAQSHISRYWTFEPTGVVSATFDVTMYYADGDVSGDESELVPIKFDVDADTSDFPVFVRDVVNNSIAWSGLTSFSDGTAGAQDDPLPVELIAFEAFAEDNAVILRWATATEINNDRFEVLWSSDALNFEKIAVVAGVGNTTERQTYSFVDDGALTGINYYRLRQVDFDGQSELSRVVSVNLEGPIPDLEVIVYPNPAAADNINLRFKGLKEQPVHVVLMDIFGRRLVDQVIDRPSVNYRLPSPRDLKPGMYYLKATHGNEQKELKVIVR